jgi:hypothetical protein
VRMLVGVLHRDLINFSIRHPERPVSLEDLVPSLKPKDAAKSRQRMTRQRREAVANKIRLFFADGGD